MAFVRTRIINGRPYTYLEERWRENGKVRSRSTIISSKTTPRTAALERYRDVLRENVYIYGKGRSGDRYAAVSQAREEYQRFLTAEKNGKALDWKGHVQRLATGDPYSVNSRERVYRAGHATPEHRALNRYAELRDTVRAENAVERNEPEQAPAHVVAAEEREAQYQDRVDAARDASDKAYAEYAESAPGEDAPS